MARPAARDRQAYTFTTGSGPLAGHSRPVFLNWPITSFFSTRHRTERVPLLLKRLTPRFAVGKLGIAVGMRRACTVLLLGPKPRNHGPVPAVESSSQPPDGPSVLRSPGAAPRTWRVHLSKL